jgi:hypothetical protein
MSPSRTGKSQGNYEIDRRFPIVGRVRLSSGTRDLREFRRRDVLLSTLYEIGDLDTLRLLRDREMTIQQLVALHRDKGLRGGLGALQDSTGDRKKKRFVYAVRHVRTKRIKIGSSLMPITRLSQLQVANSEELELLGVCPGGLQAEEALHRRFARHRVRGEWYKPHKEVLNWVLGMGRVPNDLPGASSGDSAIHTGAVRENAGG